MTVLGARPSLAPMVPIGRPAASSLEHLTFPRRELREGVGRGAAGAELADHPARHARPEDRLARRDGMDGPHDLFLGRPFQHVPRGAGAHGREDRVVVIEHREHQDRHSRCRPGDFPGRTDTVQFGHLHVEYHHIRAQGDRARTASRPVPAVPTTSIPGTEDSSADRPSRTTGGRRRGQREPRHSSLGLPSLRHRSPAMPFDSRFLFRQQRVSPRREPSDGGTRPGWAIGSRARTRPPVGRGPACSDPPSSAVRSRIATMPTPGSQVAVASRRRRR